jgi:hypothetical protein
MSKQEIEFRDPVVQQVVNKFVSRSDVGFAKYGKTMIDDKSDIKAWLNHVQEELMDATLYIQRLKIEIEDVLEDLWIERSKANFIDVVDPELVLSGPIKKKKKKKKKKEAYQVRRGDTYSFTIDDDIEWNHCCTNCCMNEKI